MSYPKWTHFIAVARVSSLCGTIESCRFSVGCLKQNGALQHFEIKLMMDVYQTVLANTSDTTHFASMLQLVHFDFFVTKCVGNVDAFCIKLKFLVQNASTL